MSDAKQKLKWWQQEREAASVVPLASHATDTIGLTRRGELVTALQLDGTALEAKTPEQRDRYKDALNVVLRNIADPRLAVWSVLMRREALPELRREYPSPFAQLVADDYAALQARRTLYENRLYLVLLLRVTGLRQQVQWTKGADRRLIQELLAAGLDDLEERAGRAAVALAAYGPRRLGVLETGNGARRSELGELYGALLNHTAPPVPLGPHDLGQAIGCNRLLFGREVFEIRQPAASMLGGVLSIKEYAAETWPEMTADLLSAPFECNWVQSVAFLSKEKAKDLFATQRRRLISAGDEAVSQVAALEEAMDGLLSNSFVVGEHNAALVVYGRTREDLSANLSLAAALLSDPGHVVVREDLAMEAQVLATLPGNTEYRARPAPITSLNFAALSPFYSYAAGEPDGHHWGEAVCMFRSSAETPLWFSPHVGDLGHTSVIGMSGAGKTLLLGFLLSHLTRFPGLRNVLLDKDQGLKLAVLALGGDYHDLRTGRPTGFNPFALPLTPTHANYLQDLIGVLAGGYQSTAEAKDAEQAIRAVYGLQERNRRLGSLVGLLDKAREGGLAERLEAWLEGRRYGWAFDNPTDTLALGDLTGFDVTDFLDLAAVRTPITSYLLYRATALIDGNPFALWIDEFWRLLDDEYFEAFVRDQLKTIRKKDGIVITSTQSPADALNSGIASALLEQTPTKIFLPNEYASERDYREGFKLTEAEWAMLQPLVKSSRRFLLKQGGASALVDFDLSGLAAVRVLSGTEAAIRWLDRVSEGGRLPADWAESVMRGDY
jgi:type IV secretion system protein VirB4